MVSEAYVDFYYRFLDKRAVSLSCIIRVFCELEEGYSTCMFRFQWAAEIFAARSVVPAESVPAKTHVHLLRHFYLHYDMTISSFKGIQ